MNHNAATPLYIQLKEEIKKAVLDGTFEDGEKLPSERDLCGKYSISRITVRQAISELEREGLIFSVQGKGNFIKIPVIDQGLLKMISFANSLQDKGIKGATQVHSFQENVEYPKAEKMLGSGAEEKLCRLRLIGFAEEEPIVFYHSYFKKEAGQRMYDCAVRWEAAGKAFSTYDLYAELGMRIEKIEQQVKAINAGQEIADYLNIHAGDSLLVLESTIYINDGEPVEYKTAYYRADKYTFHIKREL